MKICFLGLIIDCWHNVVRIIRIILSVGHDCLTLSLKLMPFITIKEFFYGCFIKLYCKISLKIICLNWTMDILLELKEIMKNSLFMPKNFILWFSTTNNVLLSKIGTVH